MPLVARHLALVAALALCARGASLAAADRYEAWLADGTKLSGPFIPAWPVPGSPYRFESQDLLTAKNPLRLMRDRTLSTVLRPPFVVLANGDILSGAPVALEPSQGRLAHVQRVKVQLEPPLLPVVGTTLAVRADRIARVVLTSEAARANPPPGTVVLADGRRLTARSLRWREGGLAVLTTEGIVEAAFGDLADVVFPDVDRTAAVLDDSLRAGSSTGALLCRFQMVGGSVVTAARVRREIETSRRRRPTTNVYYYLQPAWAEQPLALPELQVACVGCRRADEAPLSLLPATTLANQRLLGKVEPWLVNYGPDGGLLTSGTGQSDLGIAAHAHSAIAFDLPAAARTLELAAGLDKSAAGGGCVRCKIVADGEQGRVLWDSGVMQGKDGLRRTRPIDVAGIARVVLVTEFAHDDRPAGADPLDIRDQVVWMTPLVTLDTRASSRGRASSLLSGLEDWERFGPGWGTVTLDSRWNVLTQNWDTVAVLAKDAPLVLRRSMRVGRTSDVLELLVACPASREEHDFSLTVNGTEVEAAHNGDRDELRQRIARLGRLQYREENIDSRLSDALAYWWDLSRWRGQEVSLELTLRGSLERNEVAWRSLGARSAIGNLPASGEPLKSQVALTSLPPLGGDAGGRRLPDGALANAVPVVGTRIGEPIRFLGQPFTGGYGMGRNSRVSFPLQSEFRKFVAVVGSCLEVAGPLQVLIDDEVVWERTLVNSLNPAEQIEIDIPEGAQTLTLQNGRPEEGRYGYAAWAEAGFVTK